jgi:hypothetical protein
MIVGDEHLRIEVWREKSSIVFSKPEGDVAIVHAEVLVVAVVNI